MLAASRIARRPKSAGRPSSSGGKRPKSAEQRPKSAGSRISTGSRPRSAGEGPNTGSGGKPSQPEEATPESSGIPSRSHTPNRLVVYHDSDSDSLEDSVQISPPKPEFKDPYFEELGQLTEDDCSESFDESIGGAKKGSAQNGTDNDGFQLDEIPESGACAHPEHSDSERRPSSASSKSHYTKRPQSGHSNKRPSSAASKSKRATSATQYKAKRRRKKSIPVPVQRPAYRFENKMAARIYKEGIKSAQKPDLQGTLMNKLDALWTMFYLSFVPKILLALGLIVFFLGIIMLAIGTNVTANFPKGKAIGAVMFVLGFFATVLGLVALKARRKNKKRMRGLAIKRAQERYSPNGHANGVVSTISEDVDSSSKPFQSFNQKTSFHAMESPDSGFTDINWAANDINWAANEDGIYIPHSPYPQRRKQSLDVISTHFQASKSPNTEPEPEIVIDDQRKCNKTKSGNGKKVKKSKPLEPPEERLKPTPQEQIPEVVITEAPMPELQQKVPPKSPIRYVSPSPPPTPKKKKKPDQGSPTSPVKEKLPLDSPIVSPRNPISSPRSPVKKTPRSPVKYAATLKAEEAGLEESIEDRDNRINAKYTNEGDMMPEDLEDF